MLLSEEERSTSAPDRTIPPVENPNRYTERVQGRLVTPVVTVRLRVCLVLAVAPVHLTDPILEMAAIPKDVMTVTVVPETASVIGLIEARVPPAIHTRTPSCKLALRTPLTWRKITELEAIRDRLTTQRLLLGKEVVRLPTPTGIPFLALKTTFEAIPPIITKAEPEPSANTR